MFEWSPMVSILLPPLNFCWIVDAQKSRIDDAAAAAAADNGGETAALHIVACLGGRVPGNAAV